MNENAITAQPQIAAQLEQMEQIHDELHKAILELDDRLTPVTRCDTPKDVDERQAVELVPLALTLWNYNDFLRLTVKRLVDLRHRIEL